MIKNILRTLTPAIIAVFCCRTTAAVTLFDSNGFEPPAYTTGAFTGSTYNGQLEGQPNSLPLFQQSGPNANKATVVSNTVGGTALQVVRLDRTSSPDTRWGVPLSGYPLSTTDQITISWNMRVEQSANQGNTFGPYFGIEAYASPGGGNTLLGSLGVDATTGDVLYQAAGTGELTETGTFAAFGAWNAYSIVLDYATHKYKTYFNNILLGSPIGFVDGAFNTFSDADLSGLQAAANSASIAGTAYYDNYRITEVPEPVSAVLAGIGALLLFGVRRSSRSPLAA
jgi:hypothetical protein